MTTDRDRADEMELEAFFAAARADAPSPRTALLNAILADAAEVTAGRAPAATSAAPPRPAATGRRPLGATLSGLFAGLGGWRAAAALVLCAAIGFGAGLSGSTGLAGSYIWNDDTTDYDYTATNVTELFDLALAEG